MAICLTQKAEWLMSWSWAFPHVLEKISEAIFFNVPLCKHIWQLPFPDDGNFRARLLFLWNYTANVKSNSFTESYAILLVFCYPVVMVSMPSCIPIDCFRLLALWQVMFSYHLTVINALWRFKVTQGQIWWCYWFLHICSPIDLCIVTTSYSHSKYSYLLSLGPNYAVHLMTTNWSWALQGQRYTIYILLVPTSLKFSVSKFRLWFLEEVVFWKSYFRKIASAPNDPQVTLKSSPKVPLTYWIIVCESQIFLVSLDDRPVPR